MFDYTRSLTEGVLGAEVVALTDNSSSTIVAQVQILDEVMGSTCCWFCSLF